MVIFYFYRVEFWHLGKTILETKLASSKTSLDGFRLNNKLLNNFSSLFEVKLKIQHTHTTCAETDS